MLFLANPPAKYSLMGRPIVSPSAELLKLFPFAESCSIFSYQEKPRIGVKPQRLSLEKVFIIFQLVHIMPVIQHSKQLSSAGQNSSFIQKAPCKDNITQRREKKKVRQTATTL